MPDVYVNAHILVDEPGATFTSDVYPTVTFRDVLDPELAGSAALVVSCTGGPDQRRAFATALRDMADRFEAWTLADRTNAAA